MNRFGIIQSISKTAMVFFLAAFLFGGMLEVAAHGGEDHGDEKPKTTASEKGTVSHSTRLGEYEVMLKYPALEPDTATTGRLFITRFETNEPAANPAPAVEMEAANGTVAIAAVEKTEQAGVFIVRIPALPQGDYTIRANLTYSGETDTATFSGVKIAPQTAAADETGISLARTALIGVIFTAVLVLFGALIYFVWRYAGGSPVAGERMSA